LPIDAFITYQIFGSTFSVIWLAKLGPSISSLAVI
jgi:hypothetical protein